MGAERWDEQVGSVADEAGRLLESLRRSAAESAAHGVAEDDGPDAAGRGSASGPESPAHDPFCTWCPLCRSAAVVRSLRPETLAKLADLATLAATVLTDFASSRSAGWSPASERDPDDAATEAAHGSSETERAGHPSRRSSPAPSRPIPVSDADDPQEAPRG